MLASTSYFLLKRIALLNGWGRAEDSEGLVIGSHVGGEAVVLAWEGQIEGCEWDLGAVSKLRKVVGNNRFLH